MVHFSCFSNDYTIRFLTALDLILFSFFPFTLLDLTCSYRFVDFTGFLHALCLVDFYEFYFCFVRWWMWIALFLCSWSELFGCLVGSSVPVRWLGSQMPIVLPSRSVHSRMLVWSDNRRLLPFVASPTSKCSVLLRSQLFLLLHRSCLHSLSRRQSSSWLLSIDASY